MMFFYEVYIENVSCESLNNFCLGSHHKRALISIHLSFATKVSSENSTTPQKPPLLSPQPPLPWS